MREIDLASVWGGRDLNCGELMVAAPATGFLATNADRIYQFATGHMQKRSKNLKLGRNTFSAAAMLAGSYLAASSDTCQDQVKQWTKDKHK
jgi:hypothetical protein